MGFVMLSVDGLAQFAATHGEHAGEQALRHAAYLLIRNVRIYDTVGHWGGERFLVVLPGADPAETARVAERVREAADATPFEFADGPQHGLTLSVGVGVARSRGELDRVLRRVEAALSRGSHAGASGLGAAA